MVELKKIKIIKQIYKFEVKKKFQSIRRFRAKERQPLERIKDTLKQMFTPKTTKYKTSTDKNLGKSNPLILYGAIGIAIFLIFIAGLYLYLQNLTALQAPLQIDYALPNLNFSITGSGVITAGDRREDLSLGYARLKYETANLENTTVSVYTYDSNIPSEVFILKSQRDESQTSTYPIFKTLLRKQLSRNGINLNEMDITQIQTLPKAAFIIVPSGRIPEELLGVNSQTDINKLAENGNVIIYIGLPWDKMVNKDGQIVGAPENKLKLLGYIFDENAILKTTPDLNLRKPFYQVKKSAQDSTSLIYGSVGAIKKGNGAVVFVPQTLDSGWKTDDKNDPEKAAEDISKIIIETRWIPQTTAPAVYDLNPVNGSASGLVDFFSQRFKGSKKFLKVDLAGQDYNGENFRHVSIIEVNKKAKGDLYFEGGYSIVPTEVTSQLITLVTFLREEKQGSKFLYLKIYKNGIETKEKEGISQIPVSLQNDYQFDKAVDLDTGYYIASIEDDEGKVYAQGAMKVVFADIKKLNDKEDRKILNFQFTKEGKPIVLKDIKLTILPAKGSGNYGTYTFKSTSLIEVDVTKNVQTSDRLPYGSYVFRFKMGEIEKDVRSTYYRSEVIFEKPEFIAVVILSLSIVGIGVYFARKENVVYQLDVPDFPPIAKTKIGLNKEAILSVFQQVNDYYKWNFTPLNIQEIKGGFKKMFYDGRPIYVTDFNIEYLFDRLAAMHLVKLDFDYYAPIFWEKKCGRSTYYLSVFRRLRDIFVNNAVPFSLLDEEKECDTKISLMGQDMYVNIYDNKSDFGKLVDRCIKTAKKGITIVVFGTEEQKMDFIDALHSPSSAATILKLETETNSIQLQTTKEFDDMIKEMKG